MADAAEDGGGGYERVGRVERVGRMGRVERVGRVGGSRDGIGVSSPSPKPNMELSKAPRSAAERGADREEGAEGAEGADGAKGVELEEEEEEEENEEEEGFERNWAGEWIE